MKYPVSAPLIGPWLYRRSVRGLAGRVREGDTAAVRSLAGFFCETHDESVREIAHTALCSLDTIPAIDTFCTVVLERNDEALNRIATGNNFLPSDPGMQALFLFVTGQREKYARLDCRPHGLLLASGYEQATNIVRLHTRNVAKKIGQLRLLAAALRENVQGGNTTSWSDEEWEIVIAGLILDGQWTDLWRLVIQAPPNLAITALSAMKSARWMPAGDDRTLWEEITRTMPDEWTYPVPEDTPAPSILSPNSQVLRLAFSRDGSLLAGGCADRTICLWNTGAGTLVFRLPPGPEAIEGFAISPDNAHLISAGTSGTLRCHDTTTGALLWSVEPDEPAASGFTCSRDGATVVIPNARGYVYIVNTTDGKTRVLSGGHDAGVTCCALSRDDRFCTVGYADGGVGCWNLEEETYLQVQEGRGDPVSSVAFCDDEREVLVLFKKNRPVRCSRETGMRTRTYAGNTGSLRCCAIAPGGSSFAIAGEDRMLRFWQAGNADPVAEIPLYNRPFTSCAVSADGRILSCGCNDGTLRTFSMNTGKVLHECKAHRQAIMEIALSALEDMAATAGGDGIVKLWNTSSGELVRTLLRPAGGVTGIAATPDGATICAGYEDGTVRQVPRDTGTLGRALDMYTGTVRAIALNPGGTLLACAGGDATLRLWNCGTGGLVTGIEGLTTNQHCLSFSPDGTVLASGGWDGKVRLWKIPDGQLLMTLTGHTSSITAVAFTPDGSLLVTGSNDRSLRLWTLHDGQCISVRQDSRSEVSALAVSREGMLLAFAGSDAVIHLCQLPDGLPAPAIPSLPGRITALAFAGDGRLLVAGFDTGTVAVFSCAGRNLLRAEPGHTAAVTGIVVLPGGESVLTGSLDGMVRRQDLPWTRPLSRTTLADIPLVARYEHTSSRADTQAQWTFLHNMLATRFAHDIGLSTMVNDDRMYDIQIVG